jgi:hypothetical protein
VSMANAECQMPEATENLTFAISAVQISRGDR